MKSKIELTDLLAVGLLSSNATLVWTRREGEVRKAKLMADGRIQVGKQAMYATPSGAARHFNNGRPINGWKVWRVGNKSGPALADLRKRMQQL